MRTTFPTGRIAAWLDVTIILGGGYGLATVQGPATGTTMAISLFGSVLGYGLMTLAAMHDGSGFFGGSTALAKIWLGRWAIGSGTLTLAALIAVIGTGTCSPMLWAASRHPYSASC